MEVGNTFQRGDRIKVTSMNGLKKLFGLKVGSVGEFVGYFDPYDNGGFDLEGTAPLEYIEVKFDGNDHHTVIPQKNITKV